MMANTDENISIPVTEWHNLLSMVIEIRDKVTTLTSEAEKELLTPTEVCKRLKISRNTYQRYVDEKVFGQIRISKKSNSRVFVRRYEIERLIEAGKL